MQRLSPTTAESRDLVAENIARLKELFPELVTEGMDGASVNVDVLKQLVGDKTLTDADEKYGLNWFGKRQARQLALTPSRGTLRPAPEDSVDWDTTQNLMIEGDNLEVLKLLQKSYAGKVKLIYIDPPYNTGKDFVYPDDFRDGIKKYLELTGQVLDGRKTSSNVESSGRFHTDWLNMILPRLKTARNLLSEDGAVFISIDDNEATNLRSLCDEVFGEENHVATIIWEKKFAPQNDAKWFSDNHDYVILYAKNKHVWRPNKLDRTPENNERYTNPDNDPRGPWASSDMTVRTYSAAYDYPIVTPSGKTIHPTKGRCWAMPKQKVQALLEDNRIWFGANGSNVPRIKTFLSELEGGIVPLTIWKHTEVGHNQEARQEIKSLGIDSFDSPKPVRLLNQILRLATTGDEIVLDFFAGSGTTGASVMTANASDKGNRKFVLVQLPEKLDPETSDQGAAAAFCDTLGKPRNISEITKERLRRAGAKLKAENPEWKGDTGFRVFKLDTSNIRAWNPQPENLEAALLDHTDHLVDGRTENDLLYELLLKLGLNLCAPVETRKGEKLDSRLRGNDELAVHSVGGGMLIACLATRIDQDDVEGLGQGIVAWHKEISPGREATCIFRDSAFSDDIAKTNLTAILEQNGIKNVRSL